MANQKNNIEGIFHGLAHLVEKLGELAEKGEKLKRTVHELEGEGGERVRYGVDVQVGLNNRPGARRSGTNPRSTPQKASPQPSPVTREPLTDCFDEGDHLLIVAELPGVNEDTLHLSVHDNLLSLRAASRRYQYFKELLLPRPVGEAALRHTLNNGVLEIRIDTPS